MTEEELQKYRDHITASRRYDHSKLFVGTDDLQNMIEEIDAARKAKQDDRTGRTPNPNEA